MCLCVRTREKLPAEARRGCWVLLSWSYSEPPNTEAGNNVRAVHLLSFLSIPSLGVVKQKYIPTPSWRLELLTQLLWAVP